MPKKSNGVDIAIIQVTFNVLDQDQKRAYEHAYGMTNKSGYIKRLIDRDMAGVAISVVTPVQRIERDNIVLDLDFDAGGFV